MIDEKKLKKCKMVDGRLQGGFPDHDSDAGQAIDMAIEALEKQIPKKPIYSDYDDNGFGEIIPYTAICPICGYEFEFGTWNENHHCVCGQAMDWSDEDDE